MSSIIIEDDSGKTISLNVGDVSTIKLVENRTTGYDWLPTVSGSAVELGTVQHDGNDTRPGLNGHFTMDITAKEAGTSVVTIEHKSSKTGVVAKTLTYTFTVV
jgi:predicted secreted protein